MIKISRALISVSDKTGITQFAQGELGDSILKLFPQVVQQPS